MDLVIDEAENYTRFRGDVASLARSAWSQSPELRSWFTIVDRISNAENTLMMTVSLDSASSTRSGTLDLPFVGRVPLMRADATVSVTLIDPASGVVLGSATASQSVGDGSEDAAMDAAVQRAMAEAFHSATRAYAGG